MTDTLKLKPCPYCQRDDFLRVVKKPSHNQVNCEFCGGRGPTQSHNDTRNAVEMWNDRDEVVRETLTVIWHQYFFHTYAPPEIREQVKKALDNDRS